jgi:diguanylate cyclase (GGDEF)-like protein/PAS domain S-box-containing protein
MNTQVPPVPLLRKLWRALTPSVRRAARGGARAGAFPCLLDEALLQKITDGLSPEVMIGIVSVEGRLTQVNRASRDALGYTETSVVGQHVLDLPWWAGTPTERDRVGAAFQRGLQAEASRFDIEVLARDGTTLMLDLLCMPLLDPHNRVQAMILSGRDITERVRAQARHAYLASHDTLTGLPNRQNFLARIEQRLRQGTTGPAAPSSPFSILALGLDHTNWVNEALGPAAGDAMLKTFAQRLRRPFGGDTVSARLGGDVFALLVPESLRTAQATARTIQQLLDTPMTIDGRSLYIRFCVGVTEVDAAKFQAEDAQALLQQAETALCQAKVRGSGSVCPYVAPTASTTSAASADLPPLFLLSDLHEAVARGELVLNYQPQWDAGTRRVIGAEALLRWRHPEHGLIAPDRFIPIAEDSGLIVPIGAWVLQQACACAAGWRARGHTDLHVCVNVSPRQLREQDFPAQVRRVLEETGLPPGGLVLEVTESALMEDVAQASALLASLRRMGITIALDDFGTGYSSLGQLRQLPIDLLKIDRSLVPDVAAGTEAVSITRAIITMAASLRLQVLAEGVENARQLDLLAASGCHWMQGYHIGRPLSEADFLQFLQDHPREECTQSCANDCTRQIAA